MTIESRGDSRAACNHLRQSKHPGCFACGDAGGVGLALDFDIERPGCVGTSFDCPQEMQSYDGVLHGGIICLLLDAAMTNCGFSVGRVMVTGDLRVKFLHPIPTGHSIRIRAWTESPYNVLQVVRADVSLNGRVMARAVGKFVDKSLADKSADGTP